MVALLLLRRRSNLCESYPLLLCLNSLQVVYFLCKTVWSSFSWAPTAGVALSEVSVLLFLVYASFFIESGVRKSLVAFIVGIILSGIIQVSIVLVPRDYGLLIAYALIPVSTIMLVVAGRMRTPALLMAEKEDIKSEREMRSRSLSRSEFVEYCASLFFMNTLGVILYSVLRTQQMAGSQAFSGIGALIGGAILLIMLNRIESVDAVEVLRVTLFPLLLAIIYASTVFDGSLFNAYAATLVLGCFHATLALFVWAVPRFYDSAGDGFTSVCITYLCFSLGWAAGIISGSVLPRTYDNFPMVLVIGLCFVALLLIIARSYYRILSSKRNASERTGEGKNESELTIIDAEQAFEEACKIVADRFALSNRETEVLALLARGRNAKYVANKLIISENTARTHINHIYRKMSIGSQQTLMDYVEDAQAQLASPMR